MRPVRGDWRRRRGTVEWAGLRVVSALSRRKLWGRLRAGWARDYETAVARLVSSRARMMGEAGQHYAFGELVVAALARAVLARVAQASELLGAAGHAARVRLRHEPPYVSASVERTSGLRSRGLGERESQRCYAVGEWWRIAEGFDRANFRGADTAACSRPLGMAGGEPSATPVRSRVGWQWRSHP